MHVGHIIRDYFEQMSKKYTISWLARELSCSRRNIYDIFERPSLDSDLILRISKALNHNFFDDIASRANDEMTCDEQGEK